MTTNDQNNQSDEDTENGVTVTGAANTVPGRQKPAYILAREAAEEEEEAREQAKKRAAFTAAADSQGRDDENAGRPGFSAAPAAGLPGPNQTPLTDSFTPDLNGAGWITCSDGKRVRDDGTSIYAPGATLSPGQADMILQLSMQKGWTEIYAFKGGALNINATQTLSQMIAARALPLRCCCDHKKAGSFNRRVGETEEIMCQLQRQRHEASKKPTEPSPA